MIEEPWYVWVVLTWMDDDQWGIVGVCSSRDNALRIAQSGDFITIMSMNEGVKGKVEFQGEWIE